MKSIIPKSLTSTYESTVDGDRRWTYFQSLSNHSRPKQGLRKSVKAAKILNLDGIARPHDRWLRNLR